MPKLSKAQQGKPPKASDFVGNEERKRWIGTHPRLTYLGRKYPLSCDHGAGPVVGVGRATRYKRQCKLPAQFKFVALETSNAVSGMYCWGHLSDLINNEFTGREKKAFERWASKHVPPWQDKWEEYGKRLAETNAPKEPE